MEQRAIIFDSGTLISLSMACLLDVLRKLKTIFKGNFIITSDVEREIVDKPLNIKRFELEALRIKKLITEKVLESPSVLGIDEKKLLKKVKEFNDIANTTFKGRGKDIHIIDSGEASCLALSKMLNEKKIKNVIAVDERTTRVLGENPTNLKKLLQKKLHTDIKYKKENFKYFEGIQFITSPELVYVAYKKNLFKLKDPRLLDSLLYSVKFKGAAISGEEIDEIKNLSKF